MLRIPVAVLVGAGYLIVSIVATWPLVTVFGSHVVGSGVDEGSFLWNLWWVRHSVIDLRISPLATDVIFYPVGVNLATYTLTLLNGILALPITLTFGTVVANNLILIASLTFTGVGGYLLIREVTTVGRLAAFAGGIVVAVPASRFVYGALGQANFTSTAWLPLFAWTFVRSLRLARCSLRESAQWGVAAGVCFAAATLTELTYAVFVLLLALPIAIAAAWSAGRSLPRLVVPLIVAAAVAAILIAPVALPFLADPSAGQTGWGDVERFSADAVSLVTPTRLSTWGGSISRAWGADFRDLPIAFLGWGTLALAVVGAVACWRRLRVWIVAAVGFLVLSLGPLLTVNGVNRFDLDGLAVRFPLPFMLLHLLPVVSANRVPNRFSAMTMIAIGVLAAAGIAAIGGRAGRFAPAVAGIAAAIVFVDHLSVPLPVRAAVAPAPYQRLAAEPGDFAVLQLPLGWRNSFGIQGSEKTMLQSYQAVHGKRLFGGNTSRNPESTFAYFRRVPLFRSLIQLEEGKPLDPGSVDRDRIAPIADLYDLRYVVIQRDLTPPGVEDYVRQVLPLTLVEEGGGAALYRLDRPAAPASWRIDAGDPVFGASIGAGWGEDETGAGNVNLVWATERNATLYLPRVNGNATLRLRLLPFTYPGMPTQRATVTLNGTLLGAADLPGDWSEQSFSVPAGAFRNGANRLDIQFSGLASPADVAGSTDRRTLAAALDWVDLSPR